MNTMNIDETIKVLNQHQHLGNNTWQHDPEGSPKIVCFGSVESTEVGTSLDGAAMTHQEALTAAQGYTKGGKR